jgi:hypothetical protein
MPHTSSQLSFRILEAPLRVGLQAHVDGKALKELRETTARFRPGDFLLYPVIRTLDPWESSMDPGLELHGVQVTPDPLFFVIITWELLLANRAGPEETLPVLEIDVHPLPLDVQGHSGYLPWRFQSQQLPVEICILHPIHPGTGYLTLLNKLPTGNPEEPGSVEIL